jgi:hypothetical protein
VLLGVFDAAREKESQQSEDKTSDGRHKVERASRGRQCVLVLH